MTTNATTSSNTMVCEANTTTLSVTSSDPVNWYASSTSTTIIGTGNTLITPTLNAFNYVYYAAATNTCAESPRIPILVVVNAAPLVFANSGSVCKGNSYTITPGGANTYTIEGGSTIVTPLTSTSYTLSGTSSSGCIALQLATINIIVNQPPVISANNGTICAGSSFTINPTGASSYVYEGGSAVVSPTTNTNYTVAGTSSAGCTSASAATVNVYVNPAPVLGVNSGSICQGSSFTINPAGAVNYTIQEGNSVVTPSVNSLFLIIGEDLLGCSSTITSTVLVYQTPTISVSNGTVCSGDSFTMSPSGAVNYTFQNGSNIVTPSTSSSFTILGEDANGCTGTVSCNVFVNNLPLLNINTSDSVLCARQTLLSVQAAQLHIVGATVRIQIWL